MPYFASLLAGLCCVAKVLSADLLMVDTLKAEEYVQAIAAGFTVDVVTTTDFNAMTTAQFSAYKAIVIGDPYCSDISNIAFLDTNRDVWSQAVTGNVVLIGTDPSFHARGGVTGARNLMTNSIGFAAGSSGATGLYIAMSCYGAQTPISALTYFGIFNMDYAPSCDVHIVASSPALGTLADADVSNWGCSVHEMFTVYPSSGANPFLPLAIVNGATGPGEMTFGDSTSGVPYILARGATPAGCGDGIWQPSISEECDNGALNGQEGNECSIACRCVSGRPDGAGHCLPPIPESSTSIWSPPTSSESIPVSTPTPEPSTSTEFSTDIVTSTSIDSSTSIDFSTGIDISTSIDSSTGIESSTSTGFPTGIDISTSIDFSTGIQSSTSAGFPIETESSTTLPSTSTVDILFSTLIYSSEAPNTIVPTTSSTLDSSTSSSTNDDSSRPTLSSTSFSVSADFKSSFVSSFTQAANPSRSTPSSLDDLNLSTSTLDVLLSTATTEAIASSSSLPTTTSASIPVSAPLTFLIQLQVTALGKRQATTDVALINSAGNLEIAPACLQASLFHINLEAEMTVNSLVARALPANIATGSELFTFGLAAAEQIETTFRVDNGQVFWNNATFRNGNAIFAMNPTSQLVEVFYSGTPPVGYQIVEFFPIYGASVADACLALFGAATTTTSIPSSAPSTATGTGSSLKPVGLEKIVYVTIYTVIIDGKTLTRTEAGETSTEFIYGSAIAGSPCYACLFASVGIECPNDSMSKYTVVTSSCTEANSVLFTAPNPVYIPCPTCSTTTLPCAATTPGPVAGENPGFSPVKSITVGGNATIIGSVLVNGQAISTATVAVIRPESTDAARYSPTPFAQSAASKLNCLSLAPLILIAVIILDF